MKLKLLVIISFIALALNVCGQNTSKYFKYEKNKYGSTIITPLNEVNTVLKKGQAALYRPDPDTPLTWYEDYEVKPFQELIDAGIFSKERMKELAQGDETRISTYFDETGVISYVSFYVAKDEKSLLTEEELRLISKKLKTVKYDLKGFAVSESQTGSKTTFYCAGFYAIPFKDLKY